MWHKGDLVVRKSYSKDLCFRIVEIDELHGIAMLKGIDVRLIADAPLDDLEKLSQSERNNYQANYRQEEANTIRLIRQERSIQHEKRALKLENKYRGVEDFFERPGQVLHLDGDGEYLDKCLLVYGELGIRAVGHHIQESEMAVHLPELLETYSPDILILTGHDGVLRKGQDLSNVYNYRNSEHFIKAVRVARKFERSFDDLVIFAGACQSHYEALLEAGANFASSPHRILIHALDPVLIAQKIAFTPINQTVNIFDVVKSTITGTDGLGGIESRGKYRIGLPRSPY
jgi:spore coat assemly protein